MDQKPLNDPSDHQTKKARQLRMNAASGPAGVVNAIGIGIENSNQVSVPKLSGATTTEPSERKRPSEPFLTRV